jgi:hypothetical protein
MTLVTFLPNYLATSISFCLFPVWLISFTEPMALFLRAGQTFLFFILLGVWAFDYRIISQALGKEFQLKHLFKLQDISSLTAFASVIISNLGVAITSLMTGQFNNVLTQLLKAITTHVPIPPTQ